MNILTLIFAFCFLVFLFCLHVLARDDFVLIRKKISMERVFNLAFLTAGVGLFFARLVFVVSNFQPEFLNPLVFFLFPYFSGLSLSGGVVSGVLFLLLYSASKKMPKERLLDIFSLSFLLSFVVSLFLFMAVEKTPFLSFKTLIPVSYGLFFLIFLWAFVKTKLQDASIGILFLIVFSFISLIANLLQRERSFLLSNEDFILIETFLLSLVFLVKQENLLAKGRKPRKLRG